MRSIFVSQNGMAENLGQSQVLPYLTGLVRRGVEVDLVSFELDDMTPARREELAANIAARGIHWHPTRRKMQVPLRTKVWEAASGSLEVLKLAVTRRPDIVHGRSYFATAICDAVAAVARRPKVLFDCRGMIGNEYVDAGYWTEDRLEYRLVKTYEKRLFRRADGIVVLTRALAGWLRDTKLLGPHPELEVIPCCVDLERFGIDAAARTEIRRELGAEHAVVCVYAGSLGTWYLEPEMARFAAALKSALASKGQRLFLACYSPSDTSSFERELAAAGIPAEDIHVRTVAPKDMPKYLSAGDVGLSFIQSCFSKKGSSPTKVAEYLACGNVAVLNGDIGDQADLADAKNSVVVLDGFGSDALSHAARSVVGLLAAPREVRAAATRATARKYFGLEEVGVTRYAGLYDHITAR